MARIPTWAVLVLAALTLLGCTSVTSDLQTAQTLYADARYEQAQLWLVALDREARHMEPGLLSRFYYLRGMTAFRQGQREDALHFLVLAAELDEQPEGQLPPAWQAVLVRTLEEVAPTSSSPHARNLATN
jgi:hypothetical protein